MVEELHRKVVEQAVRGLLAYRHEETGFLFVGPESLDGRRAPCAPVYENFLFALLLLRRKTVESTLCAKALLTRLLHFQDIERSSPQFGNFPLVVEEYPDCRDWNNSVHIGAVVFLINRQFGHLLGEELFQKLQRCHEWLCVASLRTQDSIQMSVYMQTLLLLQSQKGSSSAIDVFLQSSDALYPSKLGRIIAMAKANGCEETIVEFAARSWHADTGRYAGPACGTLQYMDTAEVTLYDIEMAFLHKTALPERGWTYTTCLDVAYATPTECRLLERVSQEIMVAPCFYIPKCPHGYHPIRVVMPAGTLCVHCPGGFLTGFEATPDGYKGTVTRRSDAVDPCLLKVFIERGEQRGVTVHGERAMVFDPAQGVAVRCGKTTMNLSIQLVSTIGHISFGNRPGQLNAKKTNEVVAYDWVIEVEHIRGSIPEMFTFSMSF